LDLVIPLFVSQFESSEILASYGCTRRGAVGQQG
jgi:hypothetical protein